MKRNLTFSHFKLVLSAVLLLAAGTANATFFPITIPTTGPNGFNADVVADGMPVAPVTCCQAVNSTTNPFDASTYVLVAPGFQQNATPPPAPVLPTLPANGIFTSIAPAGLHWQLAPYNGNNSIRLTGTQSRTIAITPNTYIGDIYLFGASASGASNFNVTVKFVGGTTQVFNSQTMADWIGGNPYEALGIGRIARATGANDVTLGGINPRFYSVKLTMPLNQYNKTIDSIVITKTSSAASVLNIMAITIDHQPCLPIQSLAVTPGSVGLTGATLTWAAPINPPAVGYNWEVSQSPTPPTGVGTGNTPVGTNTHTITGLNNGQTYYFHIRSDCGASSYSKWTTISFTTILCTPPNNISIPAGSISMTEADINWSLPAQTGAVNPPLQNITSGVEWAVDLSATPPASGTPGSATTFTTTPDPYGPLNAATTYYLHVRKQCSSGITYSNWVNTAFTTKPCPTTSIAPTVTNITTVSALVSWKIPSVSSNPNASYEYAVTQSALPPATGTPMPFVAGLPGAPAHSFTVSNLIPQTQYWLHVRNVCTGGFYSTWITVPFPMTQNCPNATSAPTAVVNTPGAITMSWGGTTVPGHHEYHYALQLASAPAPTSWVATFDTFAVLPNATYPVYPGVAYKFWVRGNCTVTNAPWLQASVINPFPTCGSSLVIDTANVNMHGAAIKWTSGLNGIGYQYFVSTSPNPPVNGTYTTDTFHNATNLLANTKYYFHLRTHCNTTPIGPVIHNYSPWIKDSFMTPASCIIPILPTPTVTNITAHSAEINWNFYPGLYGYEYFLSTDPTPPPFPGLPVNYNSFHPLNLHSGTTYYIHIRTRCDTTNYSPWVTSSFNTPPLCTMPTPTPQLTSLTPTQVQFAWSPVQDAMNYEYAVTNSALPPANGAYTTITSHKEVNLTPNTPYWFHFRVNCSPDDQTGWVTVQFNSPPLAIGSIHGNSTFNMEVYPNPVTDILNVDITGMRGATARMQIVDMSGKIVQTVVVTSDKAQVNMSKLAAGMYLLKYADNENAGVIRIEKQ